MNNQQIATLLQREFPVQIMWLGEQSFSILMDDGVPASQQDDLRKRVNSRVAELAGERLYREQENVRKRNAAKYRLILCPPVVLVMTGLAWLCFSTGNGIMGTLYAGIALTASGLLVYGWLFDRPEKGE